MTLFSWCLPPYLEYSIETLPLMLPLDCGAKVVVKLTLWPEASVNGTLSPSTLNPVLDTVVWEIVRLRSPVLFRTTDCDALPPIRTLPKLTVEGLTAICPLALAVNRKTFNRINPQPTEVHGEL